MPQNISNCDNSECSSVRGLKSGSNQENGLLFLHLHCHFADAFIQSLQQLTIGEYIKRLILKWKTDRGNDRNTKSQALFK